MRIKSVLASLPAAMLFMTSCIQEHDPQPDISSDSETLKISLNLSVPSSASTRAEDDGMENGTALESLIYIGNPEIELPGDFKILVFDKEGNFNQEIEAEKCEVTQENSTTYTLTVKLSIADASVKEKLSTFQVMVLANWEGFGSSAANHEGTIAQYPSFEGYNLYGNSNNIFTENEKFNFTINSNRTFQNTYWKPDAASHSLIPMFGLSDEIDLSYALAMAQWGDEPSANIKMLRSLVKVEIVDNTSDHKLTNVRLSGGNRLDGRFIPDITQNPDWNDPDIQVIKPTVPSGSTFASDENDVDSFYILQKQGDHTWVIYLAEHDFQHDQVTTRAGLDPGILINRPIFIVEYGDSEYAFYFDNNPKTVSIPKSSNPTVSNFFSKLQSSSGLDRTLGYTLRNHIYRYELEESSTQLEVKGSILPWDLEWEDNPTYFANPEVTDYIQWDESNGYTDITDDARFIMKPSTDEYAEANFTLSAPMYGKWNAYLRTISGETDAFYFTTGETDSDGNLVEGGNSGEIDGRPQRIRVACKRETVYDENNEAILVIMVQYPDNNQVEVYVVDPETLKTNYTIVQQVSEIM